MLIGGYSGDKGQGSGITVLEDDQVVATIPADSPSWLARHPDLPVVYGVAELDNGRVHAWSLAADSPGADLGCGETGGSEPAHLIVDSSGRFLITANYTGGSVSVHRLAPDGSIGERTDLVQHERTGDLPRQAGAHPHMVREQDGVLLVVDLGGDAVYRYELTDDGKLNLLGIVDAPAGSGPRHVLPHGDRFYLTAELSGEVLVYSDGGQLLGRVPASTATGPNQPSELAASDRYLYVANRGPDSVAVFDLRGDDLPRYLTEVPAGTWPRHIALDGDLLYVASERSNEVLRLRLDPATGIPALEQSLPVPSPTIVLP